MGTVTLVPVAIADGTTYTVKVADNGATHYLPDLTADIVISLPTAGAGPVLQIRLWRRRYRGPGLAN